MTEEQKYINIELKELVGQASKYFSDGYRLVQIGATKINDNTAELNYSFDKDYNFINLRLTINFNDTVPSISLIYWNAFLYENEIHDLFGVKIENIVIDYKGNFYKTSKINAFK